MEGFGSRAIGVAALVGLLSCTSVVSAAPPPPSPCPPPGTNASCAQIGGCGRWCSQVCSCDANCARYKEGCCWDAKSCPTPPPTPPRPPSPPHPSPTPPDHPGGPKGGPEQFHLALGATPTSIIVDFATSPAWGQASVCEFSTVGVNGPWGSPTAGAARTYTSGGWSGLLHRATLSGLTPGKKFWYRCCSGSGGCQGASPAARVHEATAAPPKGALPVTIATVADMGEMCSRPDGGCGNATIAALGKAAADGRFSALVHAGDIAYTSGDQLIWDTFMNEMEPTASAVPYQVCPGNHEHYYNFSGYTSRFSMLGEGAGGINNLFHSFDVGGVHFAAFSTEHDFSPTSAQVQWLAQDLGRVDRSVTPWVVVFGHKALYCSTDDYYDCEVNGPLHIAPSIEPLLHQHRVDLYLTGHVHNYERTYPVFNGTVTAKSYANTTATVHVVVGMAGCDEGLTPGFVSPSPPWSVKREAQLGYASLEFASPTEMTFNYLLSNTGAVADTFTITRPVPQSPRD